MSYFNWNIAEKVTFVIRKDYYKDEEIPSAYVVFDDNKKSLQSAQKWAGEKREEITTENDDFSMEIVSAAENSSQGSKLSFWMCAIRKGNINCKVGINSEQLCTLIKQAEFKNGKCASKLVFARQGQALALLSKDTEMYKWAKSAVDKKTAMASTKTTKWQRGVVYETPNTKSVWLGDIKSPVTTNVTYSTRSVDIHLNKNVNVHIISEYEDYYHYDKDDKWVSTKTKDMQLSDFINKALGDSSLDTLKLKFPSRSASNIKIDTDGFEDIISERLEYWVVHYFSKYTDPSFTINSWYERDVLEKISLLLASIDGIIPIKNMEILDKLINLTMRSYEQRCNKSWCYGEPLNITIHNGKEEIKMKSASDALKYIRDYIKK